MQASSVPSEKHNHYPFAVWVIFVGLIFVALELLYSIAPDLTKLSAVDPFLGLVGGFVLLCIIGAAGTLLRKRWAFLFSAIISIVFVVPSLALPTLSNPSDLETFTVAFSSVAVLILVAILSILCFKNSKTGLYKKNYLVNPISAGGMLTIAIAFLIIGGVLVGVLSGASINNLLSAYPGGKSPSSVSIVLGATNMTSGALHFSPETITVVVGVNNTVTWTNNDNTLHTITSDTGAFGSGLLNTGDKWSYTFTAPGTYGYHCSIHTWMTGIVDVLAA
jgi:plastocyanin